jgi:hypothetical protein
MSLYVSSKYHSLLKNSIKNVGRTEPWGRYNGGGFNHSEIVDDYRVELNYEEKDLRMFIWYKSRPCMNIVLSKEDNIAVMDGVYYNYGCTVDGRMIKGEGTRKMVNFAIKFIKSKGAKEILLSDNSDVPCNGKTVRLGPMYFLKFGVTWYEKYFGFKPTEEYAKEYEMMKILQKQLNVQDKPCDYFTNKVVDDLFNVIGMPFFYKIAWSKKL